MINYSMVFKKFMDIEEDCYSLYKITDNYVDYILYSENREYRYNYLIQIDIEIATMNTEEFNMLKNLACLLTSYLKEGRTFKYECEPTIELRVFIEYWCYYHDIFNVKILKNGFVGL